MDTYKILIVEDDEELRKVYQETLQQEGYEVMTAVTADEALTKLLSATPHLIILDIMLPGGKNGFDLLEEIKRKPTFVHIPVIVLTNLDTEERVAKLIGANSYFIKSNTTIQQILAQIKTLLGR